MVPEYTENVYVHSLELNPFPHNPDLMTLRKEAFENIFTICFLPFLK